MARVNPLVLSQIFNTGRGIQTPAAAFLVGRKIKEDRETQDVINSLREAQTDFARARAEGIRNPPPKEPTMGAKQFREGENFVTRKTIDGVPDMSPEGILASSKISQSAPQVNITNIPEGRGRETKAARDRIRQENENMEGLLDEVAIAIGRNRDVPGAAGLRGAGAELIEGTLSQIPGVGAAASEVAEGLTGVDATELSKIRTQGRLLVARLVPVVTGDTSGRYTEQEQKRTKEVEAQLEALRTADQIEGALSEVQAITIRGEVRKRGEEFINKAAGKELDLTIPEGINEWGNLLMEKYNLSQEDASVELRRHLFMLGYL